MGRQTTSVTAVATARQALYFRLKQSIAKILHAYELLSIKSHSGAGIQKSGPEVKPCALAFSRP
jgi:hypothetical protein